MSSNEELVERIQAGEDQDGELMRQLWEQNRRFIVILARRCGKPAELEDLEQEGFIGLYTAAQVYQAGHEASFLTYASYWIKQSMRRYLDNNGTVIRIPCHRRQEVATYRKMVQAFQKRIGRKPTEWEACAALGISLAQLWELVRSGHLETVRSLDKPNSYGGEDDTETLADTVPDGTHMEDGVLDRVQQEELEAALWPVVDTLPDKQAAVVRMRYQEGLTLKQCGERLGCAPEGIRQHENSAIRELRKPSRARLLRPFLPETVEAEAYRGNGVGRFDRTWTSSTERAALQLFGDED